MSGSPLSGETWGIVKSKEALMWVLIGIYKKAEDLSQKVWPTNLQMNAGHISLAKSRGQQSLIRTAN